MIRTPIPYSEIEAVCLDIGGTILTMDFDRLARELDRLGVPCEAATLRRAEAAARPEVSETIARRPERRDARGFFAHFLSLILNRAIASLDGGRALELASRLEPLLLPPGESYRFWSVLAPGTIGFLESLAGMGLPVAAVSNSDGTAERALQERGLRGYFTVVIDSHLVGFSKPDPRIFDLAIRALGSDPRRTLHVGDIYAADVLGARRAALHAVLLDPYGDWPDADCVRVGTLAEVAMLLAQERNHPDSEPPGRSG